MIQPVVKQRFVERYVPPAAGWAVFVDIDPSEEGRTGSARRTPEAQARQRAMQREAPVAIQSLRSLGAHVGERKKRWREQFGTTLPLPPGDRDIIAVHRERRLLWVVEVEGDSAGQPEGKIYKALGQLVCAASEQALDGYKRSLTLAVWGKGTARHLKRAKAAAQMGISGLVLSEQPNDDVWLFGEPAGLRVRGAAEREDEADKVRDG